MEYDKNKLFMIEYVLQELGRDIFTEASKKFIIVQKVPASELFEFAKSQALIFQLEKSTIESGARVLQRIHILDHKNRTHLLALEIK